MLKMLFAAVVISALHAVREYRADSLDGAGRYINRSGAMSDRARALAGHSARGFRRVARRRTAMRPIRYLIGESSNASGS